MNLDLITFSATAAAAAGTVAAAVSGDPSAVRNVAAGSEALLVAAWAKTQAGVFSQITFPSGHDLVRGIRWRNLANTPTNKLPLGVPNRLRAQDPLSVTTAGAAVAGDIDLVCMQFWYADLPGVGGRLIDTSALYSRAVDAVTIEDTTTATVGATYSGARALNAAIDLLKANTDYALVGAVVGATCGALTVRGTDSGNLRCAIPGLITQDADTVNWFANLSDWFGRPMIPVFNSANKAGIFVENIQDENLAAVPFSLCLVELSS